MSRIYAWRAYVTPGGPDFYIHVVPSRSKKGKFGLRGPRGWRGGSFPSLSAAKNAADTKLGAAGYKPVWPWETTQKKKGHRADELGEPTPEGGFCGTCGTDCWTRTSYTCPGCNRIIPASVKRRKNAEPQRTNWSRIQSARGKRSNPPAALRWRKSSYTHGAPLWKAKTVKNGRPFYLFVDRVGTEHTGYTYRTYASFFREDGPYIVGPSHDSLRKAKAGAERLI